jgi:hypothetical protein
MAGITTPFTKRRCIPVPADGVAGARSTTSLPAFRLQTGPHGRIRISTHHQTAGRGQGVFSVDAPILGSRLRAAVEHVIPAGAHAEISLELAYTGSKITRVGLPERT